MSTASRFAAASFVFLGVIAAPRAVAAQLSAVELAYEGAHLSTRDWGRMYGPSASVNLASVWLGADLEMGYARLSAGQPEVAQWCNFISCVDGPFRERIVLDVLRAGLAGTVVDGDAGAIDLMLGLTFVRQGRRLTEIATDEVRTDGNLTDLGLGSMIALRPA